MDALSNKMNSAVQSHAPGGNATNTMTPTFYPPALHRQFTPQASRQEPKVKLSNKGGKVLIQGVIIPYELNKPMSEIQIFVDAYRIPVGKNQSDHVAKVVQSIATKTVEWDQVEDIQGHAWRVRRGDPTRMLNDPPAAWPSGPDGPELVRPIISEGQPISSIWASEGNNFNLENSVDIWPANLATDSFCISETASSMAFNLDQAVSQNPNPPNAASVGSFVLLFPRAQTASDGTHLIPSLKTINLRAMSFLRGISDEGNCNSTPTPGGPTKAPQATQISGNVLVLKKKTFDESKRHLILHQDMTIAEICAICGQYPIVSQAEAQWISQNPHWTQPNPGYHQPFPPNRGTLADQIDITNPPKMAVGTTVDEATLHSGSAGLPQDITKAANPSGGTDPNSTANWLGTTLNMDPNSISAERLLEPEICAVVMKQFAEQFAYIIPTVQRATTGLIAAALRDSSRDPSPSAFTKTILEDTLALNVKVGHELQKNRHMVAKLSDENSRLKTQNRQLAAKLLSLSNPQQTAVAATAGVEGGSYDSSRVPSMTQSQPIAKSHPQSVMPTIQPSRTGQMPTAVVNPSGGGGSAASTASIGGQSSRAIMAAATGSVQSVGGVAAAAANTDLQMAICTTEFDASKMGDPDQFAQLSKDEVVRVISEDKSGWWKVVSLSTQRQGWYPCSYLTYLQGQGNQGLLAEGGNVSS